MAATMDTQMQHHDDLNLMGLHELDSHLSIFESNLDMESSAGTPESTSNSTYGDSNNIADQLTTIIVEAPDEKYVQKSQYGSRAKFADPKLNVTQYVFALSFPFLSFSLNQVVLKWLWNLA